LLFQGFSTGKQEAGMTTMKSYMVRLGPRDFADEAWVAALAKAGGFSVEAFRNHFARMCPV
jgi:hypothetical protein